VTATVLNPIVGIQIVTNGDAVIADFNQMEPGGFLTSPILTVGATATRATDNVSTAGLLQSTIGVVPMSAIFASPGLPAPTSQSFAIMFGSSTLPTALLGQNSNSTTVIGGNDTSGANGMTATIGSGSLVGAFKMGLASDSSSRSMVGNNGTVATSAHSLISAAFGTGKLGSQSGVGFFLNAPISRITVFNSRLSDATLKALTQ
jgi:hypothetical protein